MKVIPGSKLLINLNGCIFDNDGNNVHFDIVDGYIEISLFGAVRRIELEKLKLLAWYECDAIHELWDHIDNIEFHDVDNRYLRLEYPKIMVFKEPIYYKDEFRYIPNFPHYAISRTGKIVDVRTGERVEGKVSSANHYVLSYIYASSVNKKKSIRCHRLIAYAWIPNDDVYNRTLINHKDGNRSNNKISNLEWCTTKENTNHALETGLIKTLIKTKARDVTTGEVTYYNSINELYVTLGISLGKSVASFTNKLPGYLWNKRYEIKEASDNSSWYYETNNSTDFNFGKSIFTITVFNKDNGLIRTFNNVKLFAKAFSVSYRCERIELLIGKIKDKHPNLEISFDRNGVNGPYYVIDLENNQLSVFESLKEVSKNISRTQSEIQLDLSRGLKYIYANRWCIRLVGQSTDLSEYVHKKSIAIHIKIINVIDQTEIKANSIKHAVRLTGLNEKTVKKNIDSGIVIKNYLFRALGQ